MSSEVVKAKRRLWWLAIAPVAAVCLALLSPWGRADTARPGAKALAPAAGAAASAEPTEAKVARIVFGIIEPPVVFQRDITVSAALSPKGGESKPIEVSAMACADGRLIFVSDRHGHALFISTVDMDGMKIGMPQAQSVIRNEQETLEDSESMVLRSAADGGWTGYVLCSLSNDNRAMPLPKRRHMLRFAMDAQGRIPPERAEVMDVGRLREALTPHLQAAGVQPYSTYYFEGDRNTYRWGNVEAMTAAPDGATMLCGMRNPLVNGKAILFALQGLGDAFAHRDPQRLAVTDVFALDLGGRGISDMQWDPMSHGYLITAARSSGPKHGKDMAFPPNDLGCALFWWSGRKSEKAVRFADVPDMKIEAICRLGDSRYIAICSDESDVSEGRPDRPQSVVTVMEFTGLR